MAPKVDFHFFLRQTIEHLAEGYYIIEVVKFGKTGFPTKLFLVIARKIWKKFSPEGAKENARRFDMSLFQVVG